MSLQNLIQSQTPGRSDACRPPTSEEPTVLPRSKFPSPLCPRTGTRRFHIRAKSHKAQNMDLCNMFFACEHASGLQGFLLSPSIAIPSGFVNIVVRILLDTSLSYSLAQLLHLNFHALHLPRSDTQMSSLERKISNFTQRTLFSSSQHEDMLPSAHRSSVVEGDLGRELAKNTSFTQVLLSSYPEEFKQATQAPFLRLAGQGKVSRLQLSRWLSQDRLYAETYICFISSLIARVNLPYAFVSDKSRSLRWRIINCLSGALQNIHRELQFFSTVAEKYNLRLEQPFVEGNGDAFHPEEATGQYMDLFRSFYTDTTLPLIEGMVVLWATEQCYLSAWTYASQFTKHATSDSATDNADGGALREEFIPNWTSDEFVQFVDEIAELTDLLAEREKSGKKVEVYKAVWLHVLDIEKRFWPTLEEESS